MAAKNDAKWQPLLAVVEGGRIQCHCGALAVIMCGIVRLDDEKQLQIDEASFWCQPCYTRTVWPDNEEKT